MNIGIYSVSTQTGHALFADFVELGLSVYGYARPTNHGRSVIKAIKNKGALRVERPLGLTEDSSRYVNISEHQLGHDLNNLVLFSDIVFLPLPTNYHEEAVFLLNAAGIGKKKTPIILIPSRTFAAPYLWRIIGKKHPVVAFATTPYSCKTISPGTVLIKRRKKNIIASIESNLSPKVLMFLKSIFTQTCFTRIPALTSLNNIGAVLHPATYLLNYDKIHNPRVPVHNFSFYMEGICKNDEAANLIAKIDQTRLKIADKLGVMVFGLENKANDDLWLKHKKSSNTKSDRVFDDFSKKNLVINESVISLQHWLDITYGVRHKVGEPIQKAIARTPTYQKNSFPQSRYLTEDIPTGLVPLEGIGKLLNVPTDAISYVINLYNEKFNINARLLGRNLQGFSMEQVVNYLKGND